MSRMPPVPPGNRSPKDPRATARPASEARPNRGAVPDNLEEQDRQGNIKQNTTHQGYQQDR